jgi:hypothetical protein
MHNPQPVPFISFRFLSGADMVLTRLGPKISTDAFYLLQNHQSAVREEILSRAVGRRPIYSVTMDRLIRVY